MAGSKNIKITTDANFENDVMKSSQLSVVDFWAEWCGPCRLLGPTLEKVADEFEGQVSIFKMNVDENPGTPGRFHVRGIPTIIFVKGGQVVDQLVGNHPKEAITQVLQKHL